MKGKNYVNISFIPTLINFIRTKLRKVINAPVEPGTETSVKKLATRLLKYPRLRRLSDKKNQFDGKVKRGHGRRQCGIHPTVFMANSLDPIINNL